MIINKKTYQINDRLVVILDFGILHLFSVITQSLSRLTLRSWITEPNGFTLTIGVRATIFYSIVIKTFSFFNASFNLGKNLDIATLELPIKSIPLVVPKSKHPSVFSAVFPE